MVVLDNLLNVSVEILLVNDAKMEQILQDVAMAEYQLSTITLCYFNPKIYMSHELSCKGPQSHTTVHCSGADVYVGLISSRHAKSWTGKSGAT